MKKLCDRKFFTNPFGCKISTDGCVRNKKIWRLFRGVLAFPVEQVSSGKKEENDRKLRVSVTFLRFAVQSSQHRPQIFPSTYC